MLSDLEINNLKMESNNGGQENKNTVQDRKLMWKHMKQQKKEAKKAKKEEEFLASLRKPKDTKVILADKSFVEKFRNQNVSSANRSPSFRAQDFPTLSGAVSFPENLPKTTELKGYSKAVNSSMGKSDFLSVQETTETREEEKNNCNDLSPPTATAVTDNISTEPKVDAEHAEHINTIFAPVIPKKKIKRKDPFVLYPQDFITKKLSIKDKKSVVLGSKHRRKPVGEVLSGNMLDSSNPIRKKGKHREIKKLELSKLKFAIIRERILKQKEINNSTGKVLMDRKQLKIEIDEYLSNLTKSKLELAEKHKKLSEENKTEEVIPEETIPIESKSNEKKVKKKHPKYRKYCDNCYIEDLDESVRNLITRIVYLQDRAFATDAIKAKAKQKHVVGLREVKKYLLLKKIKMLVVAPDLEAKDAVYSVIEDLKKIASLQNIPCVFALSRRMLGFTAKKSVPVSAFGIMNYDGLEDKFVEVEKNLKVAQEKYKLDNCGIGNTDNNMSEVIAADRKIEDDNSNKKAQVEKEGDLVCYSNKKKTKSKTKDIQKFHTDK